MKYFILFIALSFSCFVFAQNDGWNIATTKVQNPYSGVVVANGRIGILPSQKLFQTESIILNNVYDKESPLGVSKILKGMNFGNFDIYIDDELLTQDNITNWKQELHMKTASFETTLTYKNKVNLSYTIYALRNVPYAGYFDFAIETKQNCSIKVVAHIDTDEEYHYPLNSFRILKDNETTMPILQTVAKSRMQKHTVATSGTFIWHDINSGRAAQRPELHHEQKDEYHNALWFEKNLKKNNIYRFAWAASECTTQDFNDPQTESERFVIFNLLTPQQDVLQQHKNLWKNLWESDIIIEGDVTSQQDVRLGLYHLYAFSRGDSNLSIAPMGLSSQNYNGHIFWDTELWMYPPLLLLNQDIARSLVNYRSDRLAKAQQKAINFGYKGAMFPWESDETGEEATPAWALTGTFEHHITADVAIAFWNYYSVTKDKKWLEERGYPMLESIAEYLLSRVTLNENGTYSIKNVVGANEFAPNVDDNAFTNGSAITALQFAVEAAKTLNKTYPKSWETVANTIVIHHFKDGTTKEHAAYDGDRIKQADVNLLSYPLHIVTDEKAILKDLQYYEPKLAEEGPAMAQSIFAILYARLGNADEAYRLFKRSYEPNKRAPFGALAEAATSNNPYFATGAGGMLQVVLFGFGGLDITNEGIIQKNAVLPKQWKSLTLKGIGPKKETYVIE